MGSRASAIAALAAVLLVLPASTALADEAAGPAPVTSVGTSRTHAVESSEVPTETGIGDPDSIECEGAIAASLIDLAGQPVQGGVLMVAGQRVTDLEPVVAACGSHGATLLNAPDGFAPAGATLATVVVRPGATTPIQFQVDIVEVLGVALTPPLVTAAASEPVAAATVEAAPPTLPQTGADDPVHVLLVGLASLVLGLALLRVTPQTLHARTLG